MVLVDGMKLLLEWVVITKAIERIEKPLLKCILEYIESCPVDSDHLERV